MNVYSRRDIAIMSGLAGLLSGLILAFAACTPPEHPPTNCIEVTR